jgi:tellurium resistance protein TerD
MAIQIEKNQKINLTKESDLLKRIRIVLSWTTPTNVFPKYDLDVAAFLLGVDSKLLEDEGLVFYNNEKSPDGSVWMTGDEREGGSEELFIDIEKLADAVAEISITVTIHKADIRKHSFDQVKNSKLQIFNLDSGELIAEFLLDNATKNATAIHVGTFSKVEEEFMFHGINESYTLSIADFISGYSN